MTYFRLNFKDFDFVNYKQPFHLDCFINIVEVAEFINKDLKSIVTPVNIRAYDRLLREAGYDHDKTNYLVNGFKRGFSLCYKGPSKVKKLSPNLKLNVGSPTELWNKIMTEVKAKRYAGPFKKVPYRHYIQSPVGWYLKTKVKRQG